jgi:hypothetical protein
MLTSSSLESLSWRQAQLNSPLLHLLLAPPLVPLRYAPIIIKRLGRRAASLPSPLQTPRNATSKLSFGQSTLTNDTLMLKKYVIEHPSDFLFVNVILIVAAMDGIVELCGKGEVGIGLGQVGVVRSLATLFEVDAFGDEAEHCMELWYFVSDMFLRIDQGIVEMYLKVGPVMVFVVADRRHYGFARSVDLC